MNLRTIPIFLAFFLMGLADAMGPMSDRVKEHYHLSHVMATLLPFFVFIAFAIFSVPGGLLAGRIGKKNLLLLGLGLNTLAVLVASFPLARISKFCWVASSCWASARHSCRCRQSRNARCECCRELQPQSELCPGLQRHRQHRFDLPGKCRDGSRSAC